MHALLKSQDNLAMAIDMKLALPNGRKEKKSWKLKLPGDYNRLLEKQCINNIY